MAISVAVVDVAAAVAHVTPKAVADDQDRAIVLRSASGTAAIVCDGVGAYEGSGVVAERCAAAVRAHLLAHGMTTLAASADAAATALADDVDGATTLLAMAVDDDGTLRFLQVGNGAIVAIEAIDERPEQAELHVASLTIPHVAYAGAQLALTAFLPPTQPDGILPRSAGTLLPGTDRTRLVLACTDGITTPEDTPRGRTRDGTTWQQLTPPFAHLLEVLSGSWETVRTGGDAALADLLQGALDEMLAAGGVEDDATISALAIRPSAR
jgi:hypothetical protein